MHRFRFQNIWLLSQRDKKARHVKFHPMKNLIRGRNHMGKTTLIRSLFETLGATPQGTLESWDEDAVSLLEFSFDGKHFFVLHQNPDGQVKFPHPWPPQIPPGRTAGL